MNHSSVVHYVFIQRLCQFIYLCLPPTKGIRTNFNITGNICTLHFINWTSITFIWTHWVTTNLITIKSSPNSKSNKNHFCIIISILYNTFSVTKCSFKNYILLLTISSLLPQLDLITSNWSTDYLTCSVIDASVSSARNLSVCWNSTLKRKK